MLEWPLLMLLSLRPLRMCFRPLGFYCRLLGWWLCCAPAQAASVATKKIVCRPLNGFVVARRVCVRPWWFSRCVIRLFCLSLWLPALDASPLLLLLGLRGLHRLSNDDIGFVQLYASLSLLDWQRRLSRHGFGMWTASRFDPKFLQRHRFWGFGASNVYLFSA